MVLVEAQTYGVVPISNKSFSSIGDIIADQESGILIENFNFNDYLKALQKMMNYPKTLDAMSKNAMEHIRKFDSKPIARQWVEIFNIVLKK